MSPVSPLCALLLAASPQPALVELQATARKLSQVKLEEKGEAKVEAVRHRLGALAALAGAARPLLRGADVPARMEAHFALAEAHEAFARELFSVKAPAGATGESVRSAWAEQMATTVERSLETARAHLRSCVDLAGQADQGLAARCGKLLDKMGAGKRPPKGQPAAIAAGRMSELQGCFDAHAAQAPAGQAMELSARLSIDGEGRVEEVALSPRREDAPALYDCVLDGLWIWTFPGVADVELELPIRLKGPAAK